MSQKSSKLQKEIDDIILSYWVRTLIKGSLSFEDISQIIMEYGKEYEEFDASTSDSQTTIKNEGQLLTGSEKGLNGFGKFEANPGRIYHWKLKFVAGGDNELNIGIIEADLISQSRKDWWNVPGGYSYFGRNGKIYYKVHASQPTDKDYGDQYEKGDIVDIWLDLKDKYELSFAKNDKKFGKAADLKKLTNYKLALGMYGVEKTIEIVLFEIEY